MSLIVDEEKCDGCGSCTEVCPVDVIRLDDDGKPYIKYKECWYCGACINRKVRRNNLSS